MQNFQDTFETRKRSCISAFSICMTVPLILVREADPSIMPQKSGHEVAK